MVRTTSPDQSAGKAAPAGDASHPLLIAFYLPQFHPTPENDAWWGPGFTEWRNVVQARPRFKGHYQPRIPADLGFYDLRLAEVRQAQAELARAYGISAFCYYHYWFEGRRLLGLPFEQVLRESEPSFPFCLCWANEDWTRTWTGRGDEILLRQIYSAEDDTRHARWLTRAFADPRYLRIDEKPLLLVYRAGRLPDPLRTMETLREEAQRAGVGELCLASVESHEQGEDPRAMGFDVAVEFQPDWRRLGRPVATAAGPLAADAAWDGHPRDGDVYLYPDVVGRALAQEPPAYPRFRCVMPGWDNTPRRGNESLVITRSSPGAFGSWLRAIIDSGERVIFVNAWNEWAEGNYLEPDLRYGRAYLDEVVQAIGLAPDHRQGESITAMYSHERH
jgi:lipopolysaccharide biosynthesis protein